jgi:ATP-dependent DNA helicase RecQ
MVFADSVLNSIVLACPMTIPALLQVSGIGPRIADTYGAAVIDLCRTEAVVEVNPASSTARKSSPVQSSHPSKESSSRPERSEVERPPHFARTTSDFPPTETFHRHRPITSDPAEALTPNQQALDQRLREWRKAESEKLGLPQFFVLGSSTLRSIVLIRPQTIAQLKTISGIGIEKAEKFGPGIIEICIAS